MLHLLKTVRYVYMYIYPNDQAYSELHMFVAKTPTCWMPQDWRCWKLVKITLRLVSWESYFCVTTTAVHNNSSQVHAGSKWSCLSCLYQRFFVFCNFYFKNLLMAHKFLWRYIIYYGLCFPLNHHCCHQLC